LGSSECSFAMSALWSAMAAIVCIEVTIVVAGAPLVSVDELAKFGRRTFPRQASSEVQTRRSRGRRRRDAERNFKTAELITTTVLLCDHSLHLTSHHVPYTQHGRRHSLHVVPTPNGPPAPSDRPPVHALLHQHIVSSQRGYADWYRQYIPTILIPSFRPQPRRLAHSSRLLPSPLRQIAAPTQRVQSLAPHKLPPSRAPLPYPRRITPQADRRETHPGRRRDISAGTLRAQPRILCHQDTEQPLADLHFAESWRKQACDESEEG
jgi:hypothetical protein